MTMTAQERLDDVRLLQTADPSGMLRQVASSAAQVRTAVRLAAETDLGVLAQAGRPRAIVVTGMGGPGGAGGARGGPAVAALGARRRSSPCMTTCCPGGWVRRIW